MQKNKRLKYPVYIGAGFLLLIYLLFFAYLPFIGQVAGVNSVEISEEKILKECPEIAVTDYDREFLDKILNAPRFDVLEKSDKYTAMSVTADEAGFERYAPRPKENYTVDAHYKLYGMFPRSVNIQFEFEGILYQKKLYISAEKGDETAYTKAVTVKRLDGKYIKQYWNFNGRYKKETYTYGLVSYIKMIFDAMMSV